MTISDAMIAMSALLATVWPKTGPIVSKLKLRVPYFSFRPCWIRPRCASFSVSVEIWKPLPPATSRPRGRARGPPAPRARPPAGRGEPPAAGAGGRGGVSAGVPVARLAQSRRPPAARGDADGGVHAPDADENRADEQDPARSGDQP